jgi:hypothetical protein
MNLVRLGLTAVLAATATFVVVVANAEDASAPAPADSATVLADGGDSDGEAEAGPPPAPFFDATPFPEEKSPRPKKEEWKDVPSVRLSDGSASIGGCGFQRLREWIRVRCGITAKITLMCGNPEDVFMSLDPIPQDWGAFPEGGELVFAVRKGDRRLLELQSVEFGYRGATTAVSMAVISELWLPGDEKPTIIAR